MSPHADANPFEGAEEYYASYRPGYGDGAIDHLADRFDLDDATALDLGCGAGQVAVPLAARAGTVVGMDPNETMLRLARERAESAGRANVAWVAGSDADLRGTVGEDLQAAHGPFRLVTMGRSFHWMAQRRTLDRLHGVLEPGGGVAILNDTGWFTRGGKSWQAAVYDLAAEYLDDLPERVGPGEVEYDDPWDEMLAERGFSDVETTFFEFEREWDVESVVGYVFSLSSCTPRTFGAEKEAFEADLRALLDELGGGPFVQEATVEVLSGRR